MDENPSWLLNARAVKCKDAAPGSAIHVPIAQDTLPKGLQAACFPFSLFSQACHDPIDRRSDPLCVPF